MTQINEKVMKRMRAIATATANPSMAH